ncbi:tribbles -like 2, partial [Asbolus verrucosus]
MQNVQDVMSSVRLNGVDKSVEVATSTGDVIKKFRVSQPRESECRRPKLTPDRDQSTPLTPNQSDKHFQTSVVADKYLLLEQAEGSSLYRCVDVNTQEELVCKIVSKDCHSLVSAHYRLDSHPRVSSLHEVVVGNRYLYLVYPKAHGDLHSYVRSRKRLRESEAKRLFKQIAETVQVCHRNGIVLRDLKLRKFVFADAQ